MGGNKFISSEPKSGYSPESLETLRIKIEATIEKVNDLNGDRLADKLMLAKKNRFIDSEQEDKLTATLLDDGGLFDRYNSGEVTEDLLAGLEAYYEKCRAARQELFDAMPELVVTRDDSIKEKYKKNKRSDEEKAKKVKKISKEDKSGAEKEPIKKSGYTKEMIAARAAEIKQRREKGETAGFTWQEIDALLRKNKIEPGTDKADKFMAEWDEKMARQELIKEEKEKKVAEATIQPAPKAEGEKREPFRIKQKKERQEKKAELPPEIREVLMAAVSEFRQQLQAEAAAMEGWEKYKLEQQKTLLEIEVESFLRNLVSERLVPRGLVAAENVDALVADLLKEKAGESSKIDKKEGPVIDPSEKKWPTFDEHVEFFKDKSGEELDALDKQLFEELQAMPKLDPRRVKEYEPGKYVFTPGYQDLRRQRNAISEILRRKREEKLKGTVKPENPAILSEGLAAKPVESDIEKMENDPEIKAELENSVEAHKRLSQWEKDHEAFVYEEAHEEDMSGFYKKFNTRIGLKNAMKRREDVGSLLPPEFNEDNAGHFFAYQLKNSLFAIVPAINLRYDGFLGYIGGVDDIFENPNFYAANEKMDNLRLGDPKKYDVELVWPAIFEKKPDGSFNIVKKGRINLKEKNQ